MRAGIYMRLSRDDDKAGESMSIENQRIILKRFVEQNGGAVADEYIDDGYSGTSFDRPAVKRLLSDAQSGKIDTIIVKDLSRFGRNYIQVGQYIDYIFPAYGIRFIAINDNIDTADRASASMDMMPIMNVFNEWHAASTSKKIKAVLEAKQRSGVYTGWSYPYGYKVGEGDERPAVVDKEAAEVVRRIFTLRAEGKSARSIARMLTDDGVLNPTHYFTRRDGGKWNRPCKPYWWPSTVTDILNNPVYIGCTVQHKTTSVSYKNHKTVNIPESERIVNKNAHEPIISRELWDRVREVNGSVSRGKADKSSVVHALSGLLVCPDCGKKLKLKTYKNGEQKYRFCCRTYADLGKRYCSSHSISEKEIERLVLDDIRSMAGTIDEETARNIFLREKVKHDEAGGRLYEKRLREKRIRLAEIDRLIEAAFEDRVLKNMPESVCLSLCGKYQKERTDLETEIAELEKKLADSSGGDADCAYINALKAYAGCESLTREMCLRLIEFITVGEENCGGREIHIYYNIEMRQK